MRIFLLVLLFFNCTTQEKKSIDSLDVNFTKYLNSFIAKELPLIIDRDSLFSLKIQIYDTAKVAYINNRYQKIDQQHINFLPIGLQSELQNLRGIYSFKTNFGISVIIADDFIEEGEQKKLKLFLVNYSNSGGVLFCLEIAGYTLDVWEGFVKIDAKFNIYETNYLFKQCPDYGQQNYICAQEINTVFVMNERGEAIKSNESKRDGFFEGDEHGYQFIK